MNFKYFDFVICLLFVILILSFFTSPIFALDSTPSADAQTKLKAFLDSPQFASKVAKLKQELSKKLANKAYIGVVKSKAATTLTLASRSGTKVININQDTIYDPASLTNKKNGLKEEDFIAALGDVDETAVLTARKIVLLKTADQPNEKTIIWGNVASVSDNLATIIDKSGKNIAISTVKVTTKIAQGHYVIVTGIPGKNEILSASFIYVIPGAQAPKIASQSAIESTKSASPSAKKIQK